MRDLLTSPQIENMKRKRRKRRLRLVVLIFILFITLIYGLSYFSSHKHITINHIVINGTKIISASEMESFIDDKLSGKYIYLFARSNSLIYPKDEIYNDLLKTFPRIETLKINRNHWNTLQISITERFGSYLYCGEKVPEIKSDIGENCYFLNSDGYIFDKAPYFSGDVYFKYYVSLPLDSNILGQHIFDPERFHAFTRFIDGITLLNFTPIYLVVEEDGIHSLYLANRSGVTSPKIIFKSEDDLAVILNNLSTAMSKTEFANEINSKYATLLYIDLRFKNKVLYKFQ